MRWIGKSPLLFFLILGLLFFGISLPIWQGKVLFPGNHLLSQFSPWSNDLPVGGLPHKPVGGDDIKLFYPNRFFTKHAFADGILPMWNPYIFSGMPHLAQSETAVLYPLFFLISCIPQSIAWTILALSEPILAGIGMYLFLRRHTKHIASATIGACAFGFSGIFLVRMAEGLSVGHSFLWVAWALWAIESYRQKKQPRFLLVLLASLSFSILAGWLQYSFYVVGIAAFYTCVCLFRERYAWRSYLPIFSVFCIVPLVTLPHIIPTLQLFAASPRSVMGDPSSLIAHLVKPINLLLLWIPDFWGNPGTYTFFGRSEYKESVMWISIIPWIAALTAVVTQRKHWLVRTGMFLFLFSLMIGVENPFSVWLIRAGIPVISTFLPDRIFAVAVTAISIIAAFGVDAWLEEPEKIRKSFRNTSFFLLAGLAIMTVYCGIAWILGKNGTILWFSGHVLSVTKSEQLGVQLRSLLIPSLFAFLTCAGFAFFGKKKFVPFVLTMLFFLMMSQQILFTRKYQEWSDPSTVYPSHPVFTFLQNHAGDDRVIGVGGAHISSNITEMFGLYSPEGIAPNYPARYGEFVQYALTNPSSIQGIDRIGVRIQPSQTDVFVKKDAKLLRLFSLLGVKYIITWDGDTDAVPGTRIDPTLFRHVYTEGLWHVYEYLDTLPRVFVTTDEKTVAEEQLLPAIYGGNTMSHTVFLEKQLSVPVDAHATGTAVIRTNDANAMTVGVQTTGTMVLFLSDTYWQDFEAYIDGVPTTVYRADYAFRAVEVPGGIHTVTFRYSMKHMKIYGGIAACVCILSVGCVVWFEKRNKHTGRP